MREPKQFRAHPFPYHHELDLRVETLTNMGQGLARVPLPDGADGSTTSWVVFVPFALPGELVRARVYRNHKNYSEADLVSVLEPSPHRVEPRCPLFGQCGGCQYQQLAYPEQLAWKTRQVAELLEHMAGITHPVAPAIPSPQPWAYRSKITPHFNKPRPGEKPAIGFLKSGTRFNILDVPACPIATDAINARLPEVRAAVLARQDSYPRGATLLLRDSSGTVHTDSKALATETVGPLTFDHLAGDFFQNNPFILPAFVEHITAQAASSGATCLVDAYCGSGLFALAAAARFERVAGVEISASAVTQARANAERNGITNCTFLAASAEAIFENIPFSAGQTSVIIDPPRAGCTPEFLAQLLAWKPRHVVYVSCNPATQMRDLNFFTTAGYTLGAIQPFDLFPQTKHLECVITLHAPE